MSFYVGRETETSELLQLRRKHSSSLVVCYGRRRIGKSTFIRKCAKKFDHFLAFEGLAPRRGQAQAEQLDAFASQLASQSSLPKLGLRSWQETFQLLASAVAKTGWTLLLLDEISWMASGEPDFAGQLKIAWDQYLSRCPRLILVMCGSVSSWIDENILQNTAFVGRGSLRIFLQPLSLPSCNAFWRGKSVSTADKLRVLSVTGGVPRYLEEIDPTQSAVQNIHRLCFEPGGLLFNEFDQIFQDIFNRRAASYRDIVRVLATGSRSVSQLSKALKQRRGGSLSASLHDLELAGFVSRDVSFDIKTAAPKERTIRYRLSDNYVRFYLKYVEPKRAQIEKRLYQAAPLESMPAWDTVFGLQFENLILNSFGAVKEQLGLVGLPIINAGPYVQGRTQRRQACQIDLLIRTQNAVYVVEAKLRHKIGPNVVDEMKDKVARLKIPAGLSTRKVLIYHGELSPVVPQLDYFDALVPFERLLQS